SGRTSLELEVIRTQAEEFLRRSKRWFPSLDGSFRRCRRALLQLCPDATEEALPILARSLLQYIDSRQTIDQLRNVNQKLSPVGAAPDDIAPWDYPPLALSALETASWLIHLERQYVWCAAVINEFLSLDSGVGPVEESIRRHLHALEIRQQLEQSIQSL